MTVALRYRPIFGGVFGKGRYSLATMPCISKGLHAVRYMVIEPRAGSVLAQSESKLDALSSARRVLRATSTLATHAQPAMLREQESLWSIEELPKLAPGAHQRPVSRRRREVFERSRGLCHYCDCGLLLRGAWHVEHMMPRALGGAEQPLNLVAACVPCNQAKRDQTALEFMALRVISTASRPALRACN